MAGRRAGAGTDGVEQPRHAGRTVGAGKVMASLFQSVSTRTAGMNTVDLASCGTLSKLLTVSYTHLDVYKRQEAG